MGYNLDKVTVFRMSLHLEMMVQQDRVVFETDRPDKLAYKIREALAAAKYHGMREYEGQWRLKREPGKLVVLKKMTMEDAEVAQPQVDVQEVTHEITEAQFVINAASGVGSGLLHFDLKKYTGGFEELEQAAIQYNAGTNISWIVPWEGFDGSVHVVAGDPKRVEWECKRNGQTEQWQQLHTAATLMRRAAHTATSVDN